MTTHREITVDIITHAKTGLLVARSKDLPGLFSHGRTLEDLEENTLKAIKDLLAERSDRVEAVEMIRQTTSAAFTPTALRFTTSLQAA